MRQPAVWLVGVLVLCASAPAMMAAVPHLINYQGILTDSRGQPLEGSHAITFKIYPDSMQATAALWTEQHIEVQVDEGLFSVILGSMITIPDSLFAADERWLGITVDSDSEMIPRMRITSVPWAMRAAMADSAIAPSGVVPHDHDDRYYTEGELSTPGVINDAANPMEWTKLKSVPAGFADGTDDVGGSGDGHSLDASDGDPTDAVYVNDIGRVGIGTTNPGAALDINADGDGAIVLKLNTERPWVFEQKNTGSSTRLQLRPLSGNKAFDIASYYGDIVARFYTLEGGGYVNLPVRTTIGGTLIANGNLGVGTATPASRLHTYSNSDAEGAGGGILVDQDGTGDAGLTFRLPGLQAFVVGIDNSDGDKFKISDASNFGTNDRLVVDSAGNVGIGTASPARKLDIVGRARIVGSTESIASVLEVKNDGQGHGILVRTESTIGNNAAIQAQVMPEGDVGNTFGVYGITGSNSSSLSGSGSSAGVYGLAKYQGAGGDAFGVLGVCMTAGGDGSPPNDFAAGVYGQAHSSITSGKTAGVIGESSSSNSSAAGVAGFNRHDTGNTRGVWGEVDSPAGVGVYGRNGSSATGSTGGRFESATHGYADVARWDGSDFYAIKSAGLKSCVVNTSGGARTLYATESPEVWFEDFGEAQLVGGRAHVELDPLFLETVTITGRHPMKVFIQLNDPCSGVYVKRANTGFDVHELNDGTSDAHFTYRVLAKRKGYEDRRLELD